MYRQLAAENRKMYKHVRNCAFLKYEFKRGLHYGESQPICTSWMTLESKNSWTKNCPAACKRELNSKSVVASFPITFGVIMPLQNNASYVRPALHPTGFNIRQRVAISNPKCKLVPNCNRFLFRIQMHIIKSCRSAGSEAEKLSGLSRTRGVTWR